MKRNIRKRVIYVIALLIIVSIYFYVNLRGEYLQTIAIDKKYVDVFKTDIISKVKTFTITFLLIYYSTYFTTLITKRGLKKFFVEEKKDMPKLPNKSISFTFAIVGSIVFINNIYDKILLCFSNVWFVQKDPIFNLDIAYYMFVIPFVKSLIIYIMFMFVAWGIYTILYYIIVFNKYFNKGINFETLKKNTFLKQITSTVMIIVILVSMLVLIGIINILSEGFINTQDGTLLYGAGTIEIAIKGIGYLIFSVYIIICTASAIKRLKKGEFKKALLKMILIPTYLGVLFILGIAT